MSDVNLGHGICDIQAVMLVDTRILTSRNVIQLSWYYLQNIV